jgi:SRSO17 transposase
VIGHADRAEPLRDYCRGLLLPGERKSVEPIAAVTAPARVSAKHQSLLHFVANAPWSNERVLSRIRELERLPIRSRRKERGFQALADRRGCGGTMLLEAICRPRTRRI